MAHHTDFHGVYFTIQHIRQTNQRLKDFEFIVVDTSGGSANPLSQAHSSDLANFIEHCKRGTAGARLVTLDEKQFFGTSQGRNAVFDFADDDSAVICMDCHVLPEPGSMDALLNYFENNQDSNDLIQGPILNDDMSVMACTFADEWREEMWGIWGMDDRCLSHEDVEQLPIARRLEFTSALPTFEIGAMGLGLFASMKSSWLAFNRHFRGFGGEEWYIHEKFRAAGHKCLCLPWLRWTHRFGRPDGIAYPISRELKVRNYILGHQELNLPLGRPYEHFVESGLLSKEVWNWLLEDPEKHIPEMGIPQQIRAQFAEARENLSAPPVEAPVNRSRPQPMSGSSVSEILIWCKKIPRDLDEHLDLMAMWSDQVDHVTEFSERRESAVGLLAGKPLKFVSYNLENDLLLTQGGELLQALVRENDQRVVDGDGGRITEMVQIPGSSLTVPPIEETDLLFLDTLHNGSRLWSELVLHGPQVRRAIMIHDTASYGEKGDDGSHGLNEALRKWLAENPEWFIAYYKPHQYGMTVISKDERDRPPNIVHAWPPGKGPGTELQKILKSAGIEPNASCDCNGKAQQMDLWGVPGCNEHFDEIVAWMKDGEDRWGWKGKWKAGARMLAKDPILAFKLRPSDPFPGLIRASIKRAQSEEKREKTT